MKNVLLFLTLLSFTSMSAQWTQPTSWDLKTNQSLSIGLTNSPGDYHFGLYHTIGVPNVTDDYTFFGIRHDNGSTVFRAGIHEDNNKLYKVIWLQDETSSEMFKVSNLADDTVFIHMPKANSRIVVGGYGDYLLSEGHKFVVRNGNAKIEGNLYANENIGIGTMSFTDGADTYRLSVNGKVRANSVKVYNTWADYVFDTNYNLPTLYEVERFIKKNGHLKDIPSAEEVEENGIDLGEMNKLLLQKIEELTLYTIELKKESDLLKKEVKALKEKIQD